MIQAANSATRDDSLSVSLDLVVTDRESVFELLRHEESSRGDFALSALKVGVLAIRQACGVVDAQSIQEECQRFVEIVGDTLRVQSTARSTSSP